MIITKRNTFSPYIIAKIIKIYNIIGGKLEIKLVKKVLNFEKTPVISPS
jgi:hypothetical protein